MKISKKIKALLVLVTLVSSTSMLASQGSNAYKRCSACHGINADKEALGKSKVISEMTGAELITALEGYKDGTYGGSMKGLMKGQVVSLSKADIKTLSEYIVSLKK